MSGNKIVLVDTNYILRYLLNDDEVSFNKAAQLFDSVRSGDKSLQILESVLVECVHILMKYYEVPKSKTVDVLQELLKYRGIVNSDKEELIDALELFKKKRLDIVDCILLVKSDDTKFKLSTFDKGVLKVIKQRDITK